MKMPIPTITDAIASKRQQRASLGYLSRREIVAKEPKKEKFRDKTKAWKKKGLFLNMMLGTAIPSIFWYGNWTSPNTATTDAHNISFSA